MSSFDQDQVQNLLSALQTIKQLTDDSTQDKLCDLIEQAQEMLGVDSPHMATFYYEYGNLVLTKIEQSFDIFSGQYISEEHLNDFIAHHDDFQEKYQIENQNGANNDQEKTQIPHNDEEKKQKANQEEEVQKSEKPRNEQNPQNTEIDDKPQEKLEENPNCVQNDNDDNNDQNDGQNDVNQDDQSDEDDLNDFQICHENFKVALQIYNRQLKKIDNGKESPLNRNETLKYMFYIHSQLGKLCYMQSKCIESIEHFRTVVKLASEFDHPEALRILSEAHFSMGNAMLNQKDKTYEKLAIEEYISAVKCLIRYIYEVERYDTQKFDVPTLERPSVDRYHYLQAPQDSQTVSELKETISMILDKIQDALEKIRIQTQEMKEKLHSKTDKKQIKAGEQAATEYVLDERQGTQQDYLGNRKRTPQEPQMSDEQMSKIMIGLNPDLPSQELRNLRIDEKVQSNIKNGVNQPLDSLVTPIFSPCGNYYASFNNGSLEIRDSSKFMSSPIIKIQLRQKYYKGYVPAPINTTIKFSPDSRYFAVMKGHALMIYNIEGKLRMKISDYFVLENTNKLLVDKSYCREIQDFFWSENVNIPQIVVLYNNALFYMIYTIDREDSQQINQIVDLMEKNYAFNTDSSKLAVATKMDDKNFENSEICLISIHDIEWKMQDYFEIPLIYVEKIEFTQRDQLLLFSSGLKIYIYDFNTKELSPLIDDPVRSICQYRMAPNRQFFVVGTNDGKILIFKPLNWNNTYEFQLESEIQLAQNIILHNEENGCFDAINNGTFELPHNDHIEKGLDFGFSPIFNAIEKIQFSPNPQFVAVKSLEMPYCIFIYHIQDKRTIIINAKNKIQDFKWLDVREGPEILCIALKKNGVTLWKNTCNAGELFEEIIPDNPGGEIKVTNIEVGKNGSSILFASEENKFIYCNFDPKEYQYQQEKVVEI